MDGRAYVRGPSDITRIVTAMPSAAPEGPPVGPYSPVLPLEHHVQHDMVGATSRGML